MSIINILLQRFLPHKLFEYFEAITHNNKDTSITISNHP